MKLLADVGNTRVKLARLDGGAVSAVRAEPHHGDPAATILALDQAAGAPLWVASVFDEPANRHLAQVLAGRYPQIRFVHSEAARAGLCNGYLEPHRLGVDRWLAMLALWSECRGACCIASAGTALTLDLVDAGGAHLGGYIAPGLSTLQRAVLGATRFEHRDVTAGFAHAPGRDTEACVREAALAAVLGLIEHATRDFQGRRVLVGGDAEALLPFLSPDWQLRSDLVLQGLARVAAES